MVSIAAELFAGSSFCPHVRPKHGKCEAIGKRSTGVYYRPDVALTPRWAMLTMISGSGHNSGVNATRPSTSPYSLIRNSQLEFYEP
jgi:hypothetical protein